MSVVDYKCAEDALSESELRFRSVAQSATDAIIIANSEGRIIFWNNGAENIFGYKAEEVSGEPLTLIMPERFRAAHRHGLKNFQATGNANVIGKTVELSGLKKDGSEFPIELSLATWSTGSEMFFSGIIRDISERKNAEAIERHRVDQILRRQSTLVELSMIQDTDLETSLKKITKVVAQTLDVAQVGVWLYNEDRSEIICQLVYKQSSDSFEKGFHIDAKSHPAYFSALTECRILAAHDAQKDSRTIEFRDNYLVPFGISSMLDAPIRLRGQMVGVVCHEHIGDFREWSLEEQAFAGSVADLVSRILESVERSNTEAALRRSEELLRHSQKMEAIGMLAGGVAHDFNNLLTAILGYSDLLLKRLGTEHALYRSAEEIKKSGERAASLTRQLLAFSRKQVLQPKIFNLNDVVVDMHKLLQRLIGEDIDLATHLDADLGVIETDPGQIEQVIMNLAVNARDAMPNGGKLMIETANVELDEEYVASRVGVRPGQYIMLAVTDTGCGIEPETISHIFEPFFTTKDVGKGTGLGLSTVYGIVKQSSGNVWVYSEVGKGTTFKVYLPRVQSLVSSHVEDAKTSIPLQGSETILVVEDDEIVRKMTQEILSINGYNVIEAANSTEALLTCNKHPGPIQLMITDVVMPQMSGCELAQQVLPIRPDMSVLYMSGYTGNALVHHGVLDDSTSFIGKPFTPDALASKVREILDSAKQS